MSDTEQQLTKAIILLTRMQRSGDWPFDLIDKWLAASQNDRITMKVAQPEIDSASELIAKMRTVMELLGELSKDASKHSKENSAISGITPTQAQAADQWRRVSDSINGIILQLSLVRDLAKQARLNEAD